MALKKRGKTWHCHFVVNGQRIRQSLETTDWREAQAKEKELIAQVSAGKLHQTSTSLARQPFGKTASIAVIRAAGKALVLGVTDTSVTVLAEADPDALDVDLTGSEAQWTAPPGGGTRPGQPWKTLLEQLRERTIRR